MLSTDFSAFLGEGTDTAGLTMGTFSASREVVTRNSSISASFARRDSFKSVISCIKKDMRRKESVNDEDSPTESLQKRRFLFFVGGQS